MTKAYTAEQIIERAAFEGITGEETGTLGRNKRRVVKYVFADGTTWTVVLPKGTR